MKTENKQKAHCTFFYKRKLELKDFFLYNDNQRSEVIEFDSLEKAYSYLWKVNKYGIHSQRGYNHTFSIQWELCKIDFNGKTLSYKTILQEVNRIENELQEKRLLRWSAWKMGYKVRPYCWLRKPGSKGANTQALYEIEEEYKHVVEPLRGKRKKLPTSWDDINRSDITRSWKAYRSTQYKPKKSQ